MINLPERQLQVLERTANGLSKKEIAAELFISPKTVEWHRNQLVKSLGMNRPTDVDLCRLAIKAGVVKV